MFYDSEEAVEQRHRIQRKVDIYRCWVTVCMHAYSWHTVHLCSRLKLVEEKARKTGAAKPDDALWAGLPTAGGGSLLIVHDSFSY